VAKPEDKTILVVDDEADVRDFLATVLEDAGFNVVTAVDGLEALDKVKADPPDFISLDLVMPRKSGIKFLYELRHNREWTKIPVVIVTAHARDELGQEDFRDIFEGKSLSGPHTSLEKPVNPESYVRHICECLGVTLDEEAAPEKKQALREEAERLLRNADPGRLEEVLKLLKGKGR
jgi:CheY-like chemotaxis protein